MKTIELSDFQVEMLKSMSAQLTMDALRGDMKVLFDLETTETDLAKEVTDLREKLLGTRKAPLSLMCRLGRCKMRGK